MGGRKETAGQDGAHRRARTVLFIGTGLVLAVCAAAFLVGAVATRAIQLRVAQAQVGVLDKLIAERIRFAATEIDSVLAQLAQLGARRDSDWDGVLSAGAAGITTLHSLLHVDAEDYVRHSSEPQLAGRRAPRVEADKTLNALRAGARGTLMSEAVFKGPLSGATVLGFARRIDGPGGEYAGAVVAAMDVGKLQDRMAQLQLPPGTRVRMLHANGNILLQAGAAEGDWISAEQRLELFPLVVEFSVDRARVLEGWRRQLLIGGASTALVMLALVVAAWFSLRQLATLQAHARQRERYEEHIEHLANHDPLTGLPNRSLLRDRLAQAVAQARRDSREVALLFADLDRFKLVNDSLGHPFGDGLLQEMARRLSAAVRDGDTVARLGGDEFVLLLPALKGPEGAARVARKVLAALAPPYERDGRSVPISASIGISSFPADGETLEALLQNADVAMYRAKELGRGSFQFYQAEMGLLARDRVDLEAALLGALPGGELKLHYQPQVDLASGRIAGFEALMRWTRKDGPQSGPVSPARFIPVAEETGMIVPMGEWALNEACRQAAEWRRAGLGDGPNPLRIAVNLSARQFWQGKVADTVRAALAATGADPAGLEVEITEGVVLRDVEQVTRSLKELRAMGLTVAIDDFGTGYSSLGYLRDLPIDKVKIDKAFLRGTPEDPDACAFVAEIIRLAHVLKLSVVAEGVEQAGQAAFLREAGCERIQGFLFSPAVEGSDCARMLREGRSLPIS